MADGRRSINQVVVFSRGDGDSLCGIPGARRKSKGRRRGCDTGIASGSRSDTDSNGRARRGAKPDGIGDVSSLGNVYIGG